MYQRLCSKGILSVVNIKIISTSLMYLVRLQWHTTTHYSTTDFAMNIHCHDHPAIHYYFFLICWIYEQQLARNERKLLLRNICFKVSKQGHVNLRCTTKIERLKCMLTYPSSKNPNVIQTGMWRILKGTGSRSSGECCWCNKLSTIHSHVSSYIAKNGEESYIRV